MANNSQKRQREKESARSGGTQIPKPSQAEGERRPGDNERPLPENEVKETPPKPSQAEGEA